MGKTVVENLFGDEDPVGKTIRVQNLPFRVIGVLASKGQSPFGQDEDDTLICPYTTVQKKLAGIDWLQFIMCSATSPEAIHSAQQQIASLLRQRHRLRPDEDDDFIIRSPNDLADVQAQAGRIMTLLLASIASVSLLVGGIGIMNIMLVSVTERTREIGVRMAVGATEQDVQLQFLSEALVLSLLGGSVGVLLGDRRLHSGLEHASVAHAGASAGYRHRCAVLGGGGHFLWLLSGAQGRAPRPHRGAALRIGLLTCGSKAGRAVFASLRKAHGLT